jgi:hypothetical protein
MTVRNEVRSSRKDLGPERYQNKIVSMERKYNMQQAKRTGKKATRTGSRCVVAVRLTKLNSRRITNHLTQARREQNTNKQNHRTMTSQAEQLRTNHLGGSLVEHAKVVVLEEEQGDFWRTARSGVTTKLANVRAHDQGKQELAHQHVVHHAQTVEHPNNVSDALLAEQRIAHVHEHRTLLSGFTL